MLGLDGADAETCAWNSQLIVAQISALGREGPLAGMRGRPEKGRSGPATFAIAMSVVALTVFSAFAGEKQRHCCEIKRCGRPVEDTDECPRQREKLAYAAQDKFLQLFGRGLEGEFEVNPFTLLVRTTCAY